MSKAYMAVVSQSIDRDTLEEVKCEYDSWEDAYDDMCNYTLNMATFLSGCEFKVVNEMILMSRYDYRVAIVMWECE